MSVKALAHGGILCTDVLAEGHVGSCGFLHLCCTFDKLLDVESGNGDGKQAYRSEHGEAPSHIVGDDETLVAFLVGCCTGCTLVGIGDGYDDLAGFLLTALSFALLLEQTEGQSCLCSRARLGDVDDTKFLALEVGGEFCKIILADVVAGKEDVG